MKTTILFIIVSIFIVFMPCCNKLFPDEKLSLQRVDYNGNELRIGGYYYCQEVTETHSITTVMFLYQNGVVLSSGSFSTIDLNDVEEELPDRYNLLKKYKDGWGVFLVTDNNIEYEMWNASTGYSLPIIKRKGYIENDTTFHITETYFSDSKQTDYKEFIYHFKQFSNKPDSTNVYIK